MLVEFSRLGGPAHSQVFDGPPETRQQVSLEVAYHDRLAGSGQDPRKPCGTCFAVSGQLDPVFLGTRKAVGNDEWGKIRHAEAVGVGKGNIIRGAHTPAAVEDRCVGEEGASFRKFKGIQHHPHEPRRNKGAVPLLAGVQFYSHHLPAALR